MRLHWHGDCTGTVGESALQVDSEGVGVGDPLGWGEGGSLAAPGLEPAWVLRLAFQSDAVPTELSPLSPVVFRAVVLPVKCLSILILMGYVSGKMGKAERERERAPFFLDWRGQERRSNLSTVSAQTVLSCRLFQSEIALGKKPVSEDGCLGAFYSIAGGCFELVWKSYQWLVWKNFQWPVWEFSVTGVKEFISDWCERVFSDWCERVFTKNDIRPEETLRLTHDVKTSEGQEPNKLWCEDLRLREISTVNLLALSKSDHWIKTVQRLHLRTLSTREWNK